MVKCPVVAFHFPRKFAKSVLILGRQFVPISFANLKIFSAVIEDGGTQIL
jgi:hypothetical protein